LSSEIQESEVMHTPKKALSIGLVAAALAAQPAAAQVQKTGQFLSLELAMEAASAAVHACASKGWPVSVSVVDAAGNVKLQAMGPLFGFDTLGVWVEKLKTNPYASTYATLPNMFLLPGAVAVKIKGEIVAAIGVGGAPGGEKDEACAAAGLAKIQDRLAM